MSAAKAATPQRAAEHHKIGAIAALVEARHEEYLRRFTNLDTKINEISVDVKSLLASRSFTRGAWKATTVISGTVAAVVALVFKALWH